MLCLSHTLITSQTFPTGQVHQLQHELSKKDELLRMVASASEESETDSSVSTPLRQPQSAGAGTAAAALSQLESLQGKLQDLEDENLLLRSEVRGTHRVDAGTLELHIIGKNRM